ncbi:PDZ domain containing 3, isoform CRA_d [Rattus norvegicus]|uniref:PDZ domain containing 3, isoform CRA_d n=1 Tax=Rattus norvegicus TaxID=10116 RepID=A6KJP9_RAT|nr:PDZ domain containing 3, isoform CRA_d [Rattus norvegicus]
MVKRSSHEMNDVRRCSVLEYRRTPARVGVSRSEGWGERFSSTPQEAPAH